MTEKHKSAEAYSKEKTLACETALVLLLQAFGTLKPTVRLIGGLVPRYLAPEAPPDVPARCAVNTPRCAQNASSDPLSPGWSGT